MFFHLTFLHMFPGNSVDEYGNIEKKAAVCMHPVQAEVVIGYRYKMS